MFGGALKRTVSRGEGVPPSLATMEMRKSIARERSESRERGGHMSIERTRTGGNRAESRERNRPRGMICGHSNQFVLIASVLLCRLCVKECIF